MIIENEVHESLDIKEGFKGFEITWKYVYKFTDDDDDDKSAPLGEPDKA